MNGFRLLLLPLLLGGLLRAESLDSGVVERAAAQIDRLLGSDLDHARLMPEARVDDGTFVRRAYLLIVGRIPTAEEARAFLEDGSMSKRGDLVDRLVASPGFDSHLFNWVGDLLRVQTRGAREKSGLGWHVWLRQSIANDKPWDQLVREMLAASGHSANNPAVGYYLRDRNMQLDNFSNTMQVFLGRQIGCAQCHDHPFDDWTQYEYYQMASFSGGMQYRSEDMQVMVRRVAEELKGQKKNKAQAENADERGRRQQNQNLMRQAGRQLRPFFRVLNNDAVADNPQESLRLPKDYKYADGKPGEVVTPATMFGPKIADVAPEMRKQAFADWVTSPDNPYFTKTIVNRMWERTFGAPLYDSLDDLDDESATAHPQLVETLEQYMKLCHYDLRQFSRILCRTKLFERACMVQEPTMGEPVAFRGPVLRRMSAEQIYDSFLVLRHGEVDDSPSDSLIQSGESHVSMVNSVFKAPARDLLVLAESAEQGEERLRKAQAAVREAQLKLRDAESREEKIDAQVAVNRARKQMDEARSQSNPLMSMMMMSGGEDRKRNGMRRASELPAPFNRGTLVSEFGGSDRETPSSGHTLATVPQALALLNNWQTHPFGGKNHHLSVELARQKTANDKLDYLFLSLLGTLPEPAEAQRYSSMVSKQDTLIDLATAMINSKRFLFIQ